MKVLQTKQAPGVLLQYGASSRRSQNASLIVQGTYGSGGGML